MNRILKSLSYRIHKLFASLNKPIIVYGFKRHDGTFLKNTRVSSSTAIVCPETLEISDHVFIGHFNFIEASNTFFI